MVAEVKPSRINRLILVAPLHVHLHPGGLPRMTCTGQWHTSTKARLYEGTARGGAGADKAHTYAISWSHHSGRVHPSRVGSHISTFPSIT